MVNHNFSTLHDIAMEFAEEAHFATKRGELLTAKLFYQKAFRLEKIYALSFPLTDEYQLSRSVFFRSAAHLALNSGYIKEAVDLIETALNQKPHLGIKPELQALLIKAKSIGNSKELKDLSIQGVLIAADIPNSQIKIKNIENNKIYTILVPLQTLQKLVTNFWATTVSIKGKLDLSGTIQLEEIHKAA